MISGDNTPRIFLAAVSQQSKDWGWLEFLLQASCHSTRVRLHAAWSIENHDLIAGCTQQCQGLLQLHAWVLTSELPPGVAVREVCERGFGAAMIRTPFHVGAVPLFGCSKNNDRGVNSRDRTTRRVGNRQIHELLLCRVGVGRSYLVPSAAHAAELDLPPEFDSFLVQPSSGDEAVGDHLFRGVGEVQGLLPSLTVSQEFMLRNPLQALPLYIVQVEYHSSAPELLALPVCEACGVRVALLYCEADDAKLCRQCDLQIHAGNTIASRHKRVVLNELPFILPGLPLGQCPSHPHVEADGYCQRCRRPTCTHCRSMNGICGGSAAGPAHRPLPLLDAYRDELLRHDAEEFASQDSEGKDTADARKRIVSELMARASAIVKQGHSLESVAQDQMAQISEKAQGLVDAEALRLEADELEARRRMEHSEWMDDFLESHLKSLSPGEFLHSWICHCRARAELLNSPFPGRASASGELSVPMLSGGLQVVAGNPR